MVGYLATRWWDLGVVVCRVEAGYLSSHNTVKTSSTVGIPCDDRSEKWDWAGSKGAAAADGRCRSVWLPAERMDGGDGGGYRAAAVMRTGILKFFLL